jgi:soluble lytic murein transglycosylase-like protein
MQRRDRGWLSRWLSSPEKLLEEKDPLTMGLFAKHKGLPMPSLKVSEREVADLLSFIEDRSRAAAGERGRSTVGRVRAPRSWDANEAAVGGLGWSSGTEMARLLATAALLGTLALPLTGRAGDVYSFVDADGVIHVTNVSHKPSRVDTPLQVEPASTARGARHQASLPASPLRDRSYDHHINAAAEKYGLAPPLLKAVMAVESNFDPAAVSAKGAAGLMQLMPATAREMNVYDPFDPGQNIEGGARYLRLLHDQFAGDLEKVLAAYNAGPHVVRRSGGAVPPIAETRAYVRKVLALYGSYTRTPGAPRS